MTQPKQACLVCGSAAKVVRKDYNFPESGLENVFLHAIEVIVCPRCGSESPRIPQQEDLMLTIAVALIDKPSELSGAEIRFLRKHLEQGSAAFAQMLGIDRSHLSRIENGTLSVSRQTDRLVRALALVQQPALRRKLRSLGHHSNILQRFSAIDPDARAIRVRLDCSADGYSYALNPAA